MRERMTKVFGVVGLMILIAGPVWAEGQCPFGKLASAASSEEDSGQPSLGSQAGETARQLKDAAAAEYATGSVKVKETSDKMKTEAQKTLDSLQVQWDQFSKQLQSSAQQLQQQLQKQWEDFNKALNQPKQ